MMIPSDGIVRTIATNQESTVGKVVPAELLQVHSHFVQHYHLLLQALQVAQHTVNTKDLLSHF
jgi:hypothetical protein